MPADLQKARELFLHAVGKLPPERWEGYVAEACGGDTELQRQADHLLQVHREAGSFLAAPAAGPVATGDFAPASLDEAPVFGPPEGLGTVIGPYKLLEQIGEGGMGTVFMAEQMQPIRRKVALKVIKPGMDSRQVIARFEAERQALAMLDHPNIAKVLDAGTTDSGRPFFVMELVKGLPITDYCDQVKLPPRQRLELFENVCQAVQHAHQKGIIHRDLKPSNVLVTVRDGKPIVKVIDFGIAKATSGHLTDKTLFTGFAQLVGTPLYMSPEQAGLSLDIDTRSDIYSLGVLLYELLTGTTPFEKERFQTAGYDEIRRIIREDEPPKPSTRLCESKDTLVSISAQRQMEPARLTRLMRGDLDWIVMTALEKDRSRRYETANAFAADVRRYLADQPVLACPPSVPYRLRKFVRRNRTAVVLSSCLALLAIVVAAGGWLYTKATRESDRVRQVKEAHEKIPLITTAIRQGRNQAAFDLLSEVEPFIPDHASLPDLWEQCSQTCSLASEPPDADIWRQPYERPDLPWQHVVRTPNYAVTVRVPRGEHLWRATKSGYGDVTGLRPLKTISFKMDRAGTIPADMVRIPSGRPGQPLLAFTVAFKPVELPDFLIDRHEVTNAQFDQFMKAGGYDRPEYWRDLSFVGADGKASTWEKIKPLLVDQTGRPGPATWRNGAHPADEEDFPVRGVSWYEATAFARFAGKSLPTIYHWVQAGQIELSVVLAGNPFLTRSNFGPRVQPVSSLADYSVHGAFGMAGNVKEWCANESGDGKRFILGGGCGEPIYVPAMLENSQPIRRNEFFGFRCVRFLGDARGPTAAWSPLESIPWPTPPRREELLDAATFRLVVQNRFTYDRAAPLDAVSEQTDEGEWIHVTAQINAAYRNAKGQAERFTVHLYLPKGFDARKGHQTIVYFPATDAYMLPRIRPLAEEYGLDALVRSGRAVLQPIYQGMYERRYASDDVDDRTEEERWICVGQDLMRAIDYLQQRGDINMEQLGYYGFSVGADWGSSFVAIEPRLRAAVFEAGGLSIEPIRKDRAILEWTHSLPRVQAPVLMINGQADPIAPVKESQAPMFDLLGSPIKEHYIHPNGHHMLPPDVKFARIQLWFDRHLGTPVRTQAKR